MRGGFGSWGVVVGALMAQQWTKALEVARTPHSLFLAWPPSIQGAAWFPLHSWKDAPRFLLVTDVDFHLLHEIPLSLVF